MFVACDKSGGTQDTLMQVKNPGYDPKAPVQPATQSNNALAIDLYKELSGRGKADDNLFFSPASISAALMLTYEGSRGETQAEFEKVLSLQDADRLAAHKAYAGMLNRYADDKKPYELSIANALWVEKTFPLRDQYVKTLQSYYEAGIESVDFKDDYDAQRKRINAWVEGRTHDRIKDLLPEGTLNQMTRLVLVNAIYFKGKWAAEFKEHATDDEPFHLLPAPNADENKVVTVPMMWQGGEQFSYADFDGYDALQLRYKGRDLSMLVLLPDERYGLPELEKKLSVELIDAAAKKLAPQRVNVWLPRWKMTLDYDLVPALKGLGLKDAFAAKTADFTGVTDSAEGESLYISAIRHKAFIAVDEAGTEAAAATAVTFKTESAPFNQDKPIEFRCDHPFVYLIRDNNTGAILFMGRVTDPS